MLQDWQWLPPINARIFLTAVMISVSLTRTLSGR